MPKETLISVDVETAGPIPARFALLSIGACLLTDTTNGFYVELRPDRDEVSPEAMAIHGLSIAELKNKESPQPRRCGDSPAG